jgi:hypothetical protein
LYFVDATHPSYTAHPGHGWIRKGQTRELKSNHGRVNVNINGALRWPEREIVHREAAKITSAEMIKLCDDLQARHPTASDEAVDFVAVAGEIGEEPIHRHLEVDEGRKVLIVERLLLEQPPKPLDQIEVRGIGRQVNQLDPAPRAGDVGLDPRRMVVAGIVQHHPDRAGTFHYIGKQNPQAP